MLRIGLLLSGCGNLDGSDPVQTVLWREIAARRGHLVLPLAPPIDQHDVIGPRGPAAGATRVAADEATRLTGGPIEDPAGVSADELDVLVVPGGLGAVKTLSSAAVSTPVTVAAGPAQLARALATAGRRILALDEAAVWAAHVFADTAPLRLASDGRDEIDAALHEAGHEAVHEPVVENEAPRVSSGWIDPAASVAAISDALAMWMDRLER